MKKISFEKISCPVEKVAHLLSDGWTILIIRDLLGTEKRFSELTTSLKDISTRTLTLKLKRLQKIGLVLHHNSRYTLSLQGKKLEEVITSMARYGKKYLSEEKRKI